MVQTVQDILDQLDKEFAVSSLPAHVAVQQTKKPTEQKQTPAKPKEAWEELLDKAEEFRRQEKWTEALAVYNLAVIRFREEHIYFHFMHGKIRVLKELGRHEDMQQAAKELVQAYDKKIALEGDYHPFFDNYRGKARAFFEAEMYEEVCLCFEEWISVAKNQRPPVSPHLIPSTNPDRMIALEKCGRYGEVLQAYAEEIRKHTDLPFPGKYVPYFNMALVLERMGRIEEAIPFLDEVIRVEPDKGRQIQALGYKCRFLRQLGRNEEAKEADFQEKLLKQLEDSNARA